MVRLGLRWNIDGRSRGLPSLRQRRRGVHDAIVREVLFQERIVAGHVLDIFCGGKRQSQ
jgi:hypothetical protein